MRYFFFNEKVWICFHFSMKTCGTHKKGFGKALLMSTNNICFHGGIRKTLTWYNSTHPLLSRDTVSLFKIVLVFFCVCFFATKLMLWVLVVIEAIPINTHNICSATKMTKISLKWSSYQFVEMTGHWSLNIEQNIIELTLSTRGKKFSRRHIEIICFFFPVLWQCIFSGKDKVNITN